MKKSLFSTLSWALIAPLGLALPSAAWGQAIIGYGINVGRAGAAGVGAGAGLGGVFSKVNQPISKAAQEGASASQTSRPAGPEFDNDKVPASVTVSQGNKKGAVGADGKLKLKGGATIAGLSRSPKVARSSELSAEVREAASSSEPTESYDLAPTPAVGPSPATASAPAPGPSPAPATTTAQVSGGESASPNPTEKDLVATSEPVAEESSAGSATAEQAQTAPARKRGVLSPVTAGSSDPAENGNGEEVAGKEETTVVAPGDKVADLIARLGKPTMVLKGIGGNGYNEKYIFRKPDGGKITVLALHGTVTAVIDSSTGLPLRASLP